MEECPFCGRPTNQGLYIEIDKVSPSQQGDGGIENPLGAGSGMDRRKAGLSVGEPPRAFFGDKIGADL